MHELGVVFHVVDQLKEIGEINKLNQIHKVVIELGEVSAVLEDYLVDCWNWAIGRESPLLNKCAMDVIRIPAITYCENCNSQYETVKYGKICPNCNKDTTFLIQGNEFNIKEIEAE